MQFRNEVKHEISSGDLLILRQRLRMVMKPDEHAVDGRYEIRSLYFDNLDDKALREKLDGVNIREKYRIRLYNHDHSIIHLERKFKHGGFGYKDSANLTPEQLAQIISLAAQGTVGVYLQQNSVSDYDKEETENEY